MKHLYNSLDIGYFTDGMQINCGSDSMRDAQKAPSLNKVGGSKLQIPLDIMLGKSHFYKIVLSLVKTITHKLWTFKTDFAQF